MSYVLIYANNKGADQPAHWHSLVGPFWFLESITDICDVCPVLKILLVYIAMQAIHIDCLIFTSSKQSFDES